MSDTRHYWYEYGVCLGPKQAQLGTPRSVRTSDKGRAIKDWNTEPLDLLNGQALDCINRPLRYESNNSICFASIITNRTC